MNGGITPITYLEGALEEFLRMPAISQAIGAIYPKSLFTHDLSKVFIIVDGGVLHAATAKSAFNSIDEFITATEKGNADAQAICWSAQEDKQFGEAIGCRKQWSLYEQVEDGKHIRVYQYTPKNPEAAKGELSTK